MLDGARTMFNAYQQNASTKKESIDPVKLGLRECTQVSFEFYIKRFLSVLFFNRLYVQLKLN
jgi:hypothetical protein